VVIGTVLHDIHDFGKDIVATVLRSNGCGSSTPSIWDGATPSFDLKVALSATVGCGRGSAETRSGLSTAPAHFRAERQHVDEALPHATVSCQARVRPRRTVVLHGQ